MKNIKDRFYQAFQLMADLGDYANEQKRKFPVGTTEQNYWQDVALKL
jgi:hypothetical protein